MSTRDSITWGFEREDLADRRSRGSHRGTEDTEANSTTDRHIPGRELQEHESRRITRIFTNAIGYS